MAGDGSVFNPGDTEPGARKLEGEDIPEEFRGMSWNEIGQLKESAGKVKDLEEKVTQAEAKAVEAEAKAVAPPPPPRPPSAEDQKQLEDLYYTNPTAAVDRQVAARIAPLMQTLSEGRVEEQKERLRDKHKDFSKYEGEIDAIIKPMPAELKARAGVVEQAYKFARANHLEELEAEAAARAGTGTSPVTTSGTPPPAGEDKRPGLKQEVDAEFGIKTAEESAKWKDPKQKIQQ